METSISVTVRWKAGFANGYEPQTFRLEYKEATETGSIDSYYLFEEIQMKELLSRRQSTHPNS